MNKKLIPPAIAAAITIAIFFNTKIFISTVTLPIITFFSIWSIQVSIVNKWKFDRLGVLPCLIGIFGFLQGQSKMFSYVANYMGSHHELPMSNYGLIANAMPYNATSFEVLLLGCGLSLALYTIRICVLACQKNPVE